MSIKPCVHLFTSLVFLIVLTNCVPNHPVSSVPPIETVKPQPPPDVNNTPSALNDAVHVSPLSPGIQEITGVVLSGGDQTPEGLLGGPRRFAFEIQLDSGEMITLTYTAYPPSPSGDAEPRPKLDFYRGTIEPGDGIFARGTYDPSSKTLTVDSETDFIKTFAK